LPRPKKSFSPEFKDEAVKMVIETSRPIARVAKELGINEIEFWYNSKRRHSGLQYRTPQQVHNEYLERLSAA
jgi:transposase-like protein